MVVIINGGFTLTLNLLRAGHHGIIAVSLALGVFQPQISAGSPSRRSLRLAYDTGVSSSRHPESALKGIIVNFLAPCLIKGNSEIATLRKLARNDKILYPRLRSSVSLIQHIGFVRTTLTSFSPSRLRYGRFILRAGRGAAPYIESLSCSYCHGF